MMTAQTGFDSYKRRIMSLFDMDSSIYGTPAAYGSRGALVQARMEREAVLKIINSLEFEVGLDVGCGPGRYMAFVARRREVIGLDVSSGIAIAAKQSGIESDVVRADMETIPFRDCAFGLVYSIRAMKYLKNQEKFLHEVQRVCSTNGCVLLYDIWNAKNVSNLLSQTCLRFASILRPRAFPEEMHRMDHISIRRRLEQSGEYKVQTRGVLFLPQLLYARTYSQICLRIFMIVDALFSSLPLSEYFAYSVLYLAKKRS